MKKATLLILLSLISSLTIAQNKLRPDTISNRLWQQTCLFPNEKIHLHTDRSLYAAGDTIWFRAYLVNALDNKQETADQYIYTELIDSLGKNVYRVKIKQDKNSLFYGHLPMDYEIPTGQYILRAYTRYMENAGEEFFFHKPIHIMSPFNKSLSTEISVEGERRQKRGKDNNDYQVDFLPEGGNLIAGVASKMAFKALNTNGLSEEITGTIKDETGKTICSFQTTHAGMGAFNWIPEAGKKYYAECVSRADLEKRFELPVAVTNTSTLKIDESNFDYHISILYANGVATNETQILLIHQRGFPLFAQPFQQTHRISIGKKAFSPGIIHLLLLSSQGKIISERQVFVNPDKQATVHIRPDKESYAPREKVRLDIALQNAKGKPVQGNFSIAVTDNADLRPDSSYTIYTSLLLSSDLKGYIEDPGWYFRGNDNARKEELDLLMLTQGWRKYNIESALTADYKQPTILPETSQRITGSVKRLVGNNTIANAKIQIHIPTEKVLEEIHAGEDGKFKLDHFEFPDSTLYYIQATTKNNGKNVLLSLDPETFPKVHQIFPSNSYSIRRTSETSQPEIPLTTEFLEKANKRIRYENGMHNIFLEDVIVTAKKKVYKTPYESIPSAITFKEKEIKQSSQIELIPYLVSKLPGIVSKPQGLFQVRELGNPTPTPIQIILNEFPIYDAQTAKIILETLKLQDVEQIDYNRETASGLVWFSMTGASFIAITLKKDASEPNGMPKNIQQIQLLGHQKPVAFYSPKYETPKQNNNETPDLRTTIYWNPNLKTNRRGKTFVEFYTADGNAPYSVIIEGITQDGQFLRKVKNISSTYLP